MYDSKWNIKINSKTMVQFKWFNEVVSIIDSLEDNI